MKEYDGLWLKKLAETLPPCGTSAETARAELTAFSDDAAMAALTCAETAEQIALVRYTGGSRARLSPFRILPPPIGRRPWPIRSSAATTGGRRPVSST